jgi:hypothetical protein
VTPNWRPIAGRATLTMVTSMMFMNIAATNTTLTAIFWFSRGLGRSAAVTGAMGDSCSIIGALLDEVLAVSAPYSGMGISLSWMRLPGPPVLSSGIEEMNVWTCSVLRCAANAAASV